MTYHMDQNIAIAICITLTLIIGYITFFIKKKLSFLHNSIVFMMTTILTKNIMTIRAMEFNLVKTTEDPFLFLSILIYREIMIPLLIVIFINLYLQFTWNKRVFLYITILVFMQIMEFISLNFGVVEYIQWNMLYDLLVNSSYMIIGLGISRILIIISNGEGVLRDSNL